MYNSLILNEQGGSVLRADSGGKINVKSGASIVIDTGGAFFLGGAQFIFAASAEGPAGLPVSASPGSVFFRSDGSASNFYINVSTGAAGSVWKSASIYN
jgi:hypothetical protein